MSSHDQDHPLHGTIRNVTINEMSDYLVSCFDIDSEVEFMIALGETPRNAPMTVTAKSPKPTTVLNDACQADIAMDLGAGHLYAYQLPDGAIIHQHST